MKETKILLVEDDPDHAGLIIDILEAESNTTVSLKSNGQDAIEYFQKVSNEGKQAEIDLVVLDLNLPKINGMDVLKFIKCDPGCNSIPVVVFSTSSDHKTIDEAYRNGASAYITKDASYDIFVKNLEKLKQFYNPPAQIKRLKP